ncbi:hypothetical protein AAE478_007502 [Parahypoxylon ruwenzoriense]
MSEVVRKVTPRRTIRTGICGSDVHYWQRGRIGDFILNRPMVLGHESSGTVIEVGSKVKNVKPGDRVAIEPVTHEKGLNTLTRAHRCDYCRSGAYNLCADTIFAATPPWDGTLQKYYLVAADFCYPLSAHMSAEDGALVEPVAVSVQICKDSFGADDVFVPDWSSITNADPVEASRKVAEVIVNRFSLGGGADVVLECTGAEPCIQAGVFATKKGGTYVQAGMGKENVVFPITTACIRALNIKGSIRYTTGCYPSAVNLIASGKIDPRALITHRFKFEQALEAFELARKGKEDTMKVMIEGVQ